MSKPTTTFWNDSLALKKLRQRQAKSQPLRLAFLDIDGTWTGNPPDQLALRHTLEQQGYIVICTTNRDLEYNLSFDAFRQAEEKIAIREYGDVDRATVLAFSGLLDPDIVVSTLGEEITIQQTSGRYHIDETYSEMVIPKNVDWLSFVNELVNQVEEKSGQTIGTLLPSSHFRIQIIFSTLDEKRLFQRTIEEMKKAVVDTDEIGQLLAITTLTDESDPYIEPPFFSVFVTPQSISKKNAVEHIVTSLTEELSISPSQFEVLLAGDGPADAAMGFYGAAGTSATFVIPGGARLTRFIAEEASDYLGVEGATLKNDLSSLTDRTIIIGDEAFPGTTGPTTLLAWLNTPR